MTVVRTLYGYVSKYALVVIDPNRDDQRITASGLFASTVGGKLKLSCLFTISV